MTGFRLLLACVFSVLLAVNAGAIGVDERPLDDPASETRARELMRDFRCLVCQNQSIEDSDAPLAGDLRAIVRERVEAGDTDSEVRDYLVDRYGDWVLLKPPFALKTAILWLAPFFLLLAGLVYLTVKSRRKDTDFAPQPLTTTEESRLQKLLDDHHQSSEGENRP